MKTVCIYHSIDLDGWMSAAIVKHWNNQNQYSNLELVHPIDFIGYNYGQPIPDLSEYDKVIMCDISFPMKSQYDEMWKIYTNSKVIKDVIWIDHHISAINDYENCIGVNPNIKLDGLRDTKFAACELTWKYFFPNKTMPEIVRLLGRYDCFGHKGTEEEQKVLEFQYGARTYMSDHQSAYEKLTATLLNEYSNERLLYQISTAGAAIYSYLCTEAKQSYKNGFKILLPSSVIDTDTTGGVDYQPYEFICINKERFNPINFGIDYHKDGYDGSACFHYDGIRQVWAFSLYNDNGLVDCSVIAKQFGGGGHKGASGFVVKDLSEVFK